MYIDTFNNKGATDATMPYNSQSLHCMTSSLPRFTPFHYSSIVQYPSTPPFSSASLIQDRSWAERYTGCRWVNPGRVANVADIERERLLFTLTLTPTANLGSPVNPCMWEESYIPPGPMQERSVWPSYVTVLGSWLSSLLRFLKFHP